MDKMQKELATVINGYFGVDAAYLDIDVFTLAKRIIEAGWTKPDASDNNKWIPVTERLPDSNGMYLCLWRYANEDETQMDVLHWDGKRFPWEDFCWHGQHIVTHWMPLPETPKGE